MDLPEKLLPRISSRMGVQRLCFGPYNHQQLQEIISSRLKGIEAFEKQAIEFASRKVGPCDLVLSWNSHLSPPFLFTKMFAGSMQSFPDMNFILNWLWTWFILGCSHFRRCTSCFGDLQACSGNCRLSH